MNSTTIQIETFQNIGKRSYQEDALYISPDHQLFMVCDGVGGGVKGSLASQTVIDVVAQSYHDAAGGPWDPAAALAEAGQRLGGMANQDPSLVGMASTVALVYRNGSSSLLVLHIGDSRVYKINHQEKDFWCTKDHSIVQELYDNGVLPTKEDMRRHPLKNRITRALVASDSQDSSDTEPTINTIDSISPGTVILLCSDGVIEHISDEELVNFTADNDFAAGIDAINKRCQLESNDNNTCIAIKF